MSKETQGETTSVLAAAHRVVPQGPPLSAVKTEAFVVQLGSWTYPLAWTGIYTLHAVSAAHLIASARLFQIVPTMAVAYSLDFFNVGLPIEYAPTIAVFYYLVGGIHCLFLAMPIVRMMYRSVLWVVHKCKRGTAIHPESQMTSRILSAFASVSAIQRGIESRIPRQFYRPVAMVYKHVFGRRGWFGVEFRHHDTVFVVREIVETTLQSYQAYHMCRSLVRPGLNRLFVGTLIINCWATPVLHHLVDSKPLQRLLARLCDIMLDFVASVGVPLVLTLTYIRAYDPEIRDFPSALWYDDKWLTNMLKEVSIIFFGSWLDALSRLMFSLGLLSSLDDAKQLLQCVPGASLQSTAAKAWRLSTKPAAPSGLAAPSQTHGDRSRMLILAHRLMFLYGFVVLGVHLHAELRSHPAGSCLLPVRPWLVSKPACSLVEVNCWRDRTLTGDANDFARHIGTLDALSLAHITFRHCSQVTLQAPLEQFPNLTGLKFYNVTLVSWEDDAALRERFHPNMRFVFFVRTTFPSGSLPAGMLAHDFPLLLNDLQFSFTNIASIPDDLDQRWPPNVALNLEYGKLTEYPPVFARMQFYTMTVAGNQITSIPAEAFETPGLHCWGSFSGNPITELPSDVNISRVKIIYFEIVSTNVSTMPPWVGEWLMLVTEYYVYASLTPWCEHVGLTANASERAANLWFDSVICTDPGPDLSVYPQSFEERADEIW